MGQKRMWGIFWINKVKNEITEHYFTKLCLCIRLFFMWTSHIGKSSFLIIYDLYFISYTTMLYFTIYIWKPLSHNQSPSHSLRNWPLILGCIGLIIFTLGWVTFHTDSWRLTSLFVPSHHWIVMTGCDPLTLIDDLDDSCSHMKGLILPGFIVVQLLLAEISVSDLKGTHSHRQSVYLAYQ